MGGMVGREGLPEINGKEAGHRTPSALSSRSSRTSPPITNGLNWRKGASGIKTGKLRPKEKVTCLGWLGKVRPRPQPPMTSSTGIKEPARPRPERRGHDAVTSRPSLGSENSFCPRSRPPGPGHWIPALLGEKTALNPPRPRRGSRGPMTPLSLTVTLEGWKEVKTETSRTTARPWPFLRTGCVKSGNPRAQLSLIAHLHSRDSPGATASDGATATGRGKRQGRGWKPRAERSRLTPPATS